MKFALLAGGLLAGTLMADLGQLKTLVLKNWYLPGGGTTAGGLDLSRYQVEIEGRVLDGVEDDLSALTYDAERDSLWAVLNGVPLLLEISLDGDILRRIRVEGIVDMEGLAHIGGSRFVVAEERTHRLYLLDVPEDAQQIYIEHSPTLTLGLDVDGNKGLEGVAWDAQGERLLVVKERDPLRVLSVTGFVVHGDDVHVHIAEVKPSDSTRLFMTDLSSLHFHERTGQLMLLSDESEMLVAYDEDQYPASILELGAGHHGLENTVPQAEGVTMDAREVIYVVSEPNLFYRFSPLDRAQSKVSGEAVPSPVVRH